MAKLVKSKPVVHYVSSAPYIGDGSDTFSEIGPFPSWKLLDDHYIGKSGAVETNDDDMLELGTVDFNGDAFMFTSDAENGIDYTANQLREIADLMDGLEKERAAAAGK